MQRRRKRMINLLFYFLMHTVIALCIAVPFGTIHEYLHKRKAIQLGCKVESGPKFKNETVVNTTDPVKIKKIARAPYVVIVPINIIILVIGIYLLHIGLLIGSGATLLMHAISYPLEGKLE